MSRSHAPLHLRALARASHDRAARARRLAQALVLKSDRELIADAVAAGRLRVVPPGASGLPGPPPERRPSRR